jgi:hypothetical protein
LLSSKVGREGYYLPFNSFNCHFATSNSFVFLL